MQGQLSFVAEDLRPVGLAVGVDADTGMARFGAGVGVGHEDEIVAKEPLEKLYGWRVGDEGGDGAADELCFRTNLLFHTVINGDRVQALGLYAQNVQVIRGEQTGQDGVTFDFNLIDVLTESQLRPVTVVDFDFNHGFPPIYSGLGQEIVPGPEN